MSAPVLSFAEARTVGAKLAEHFERVRDNRVPPAGAHAWGDIVQLVLSESAAVVAVRESEA